MLIRAFVPLALLFTPISFANAEDGDMAGGKIVRFECGDNCYLTIKPEDGEEITGLCEAETCQPWNEVAEIPQDLIGTDAEVTLGTGKQFDAEGNEMGETISFTVVKTGDFQ